MKLTALENKLIAAARAHAPSDHVPYAFEQRILARLADARPFDTWALWSQALWRAAVSCVLLTAVSGALALWHDHAAGTDFSDDFETAVFVAAAQAPDSW